jgi:D-alanyl-lipoteichoic acid acyltransferase DltB (MBOAT superfamily)
MLFNSHEFILLFLPLVLVGYFAAARRGTRVRIGWLFGASLFFYGWWNYRYLGLLLGSILFNFLIGLFLVSTHSRARASVRRAALIGGIAGNLSLLGYFKYAGFVLENLNWLFESNVTLDAVILPLGISFFTFTQIAFLVDAYRNRVRDLGFLKYGLFVTYFPHLIAGPILRHQDVMPQFTLPSSGRPHSDAIAAGLALFSIGLCKKVVIADSLAPFAQVVFGTAAEGPGLTFVEAWVGALAYTFQLYFDFSGYSDMAVGLSWMFGVALPFNFNSPYQALNIVDFWRRWHITLSRFFRDYLYIPLGGNRRGAVRRVVNVMVTMVLGGLWHGANWTFVFWGALHGIYVLAYQGWRAFRAMLGWAETGATTVTGRAFGRLLTFLAVVVAWVFFRAETWDAGLAMLQGMAGLNGLVLPERWLPKLGALGEWLQDLGVGFQEKSTFTNLRLVLTWIACLLLVVWFAPNSQQIVGLDQEGRLSVSSRDVARAVRWRRRPSWGWACLIGAVLAFGILNLNRTSEFLYFQF